MTTDIIEPLVKTAEVPHSADDAFDLFTARMAEWWPLQTHSVGGDRARSVTMDGRLGGQIVETIDGGATEVWGTITQWLPGRTVAFSWHPGQPVDEATYVEVHFEQLAGDRTRVTLVHDRWQQRPDALAARTMYDTGWDVVIARYVALSSSNATSLRGATSR